MSATTTEGTGNGSVENVKPRIVNGVVKSENVAEGAVSAASIADSSLTVSKMKYFKSSEQTGTGSAQNVAHGLAVTPALVMVYPTDLSPATTGEYVVTEGTHTSTNVVVTVTTGKKFKVVAFA